ncbi:MAG: redoxin domain-containing protein [Acidobacteria bacterium]|nr:redoxin domain-containing protein [Acidobacteriota bacterium]
MKRLIFASLLCVFALTAFSFKALAQSKLGPKDGTGLPPADLNRIKVGEAAPDFTLEDKDGKPVMLSGYRERKSVVLVFYRGYW